MMLKVRGLEASYGKMKVLNGIDMDVDKGDLVAIIGPNGSGKSTTIKTIFGLVKADSGSVMYKDKSITKKRPDQIVRLGMAYVPQGRIVFETLTVQENLEMGGFLLKDKSEVKRRIGYVFGLFPDLKEKKNQKATFLSGGQQQMLSIGRALMLKPDLLMLDEPSLGLAPKTMMGIFRKIRQLNKEGMTIILVEQNAFMALEICSRSYVLEGGRIAMHDGAAIRKQDRIKKLYLGD